MTVSNGASTVTTPDLLEAIIGATRHSVTARQARRPWRVVEAAAAGRRPRGEAFRQGLRVGARLNVIAECKRRSPARGILRPAYDPVAIAVGYQAAGAAAVSVLTEPAFFDGALDHLTAVRAAVELPVLRKDFIITEYQLAESHAAGADAVLLIVAALDDATLGGLIRAAETRGLAALVEVHDATELERALEAGADIVGVNNRNLRTLEVRLDASASLIDRIPDGVVAVAESGLKTPDDLRRLHRAGFDAFLVGESLISQPDPGLALRALVKNGPGSPRPARRRS